ncbi:MAG: hypothetical protein ACI9LO_003435 [Planctomycetota bacterium]|jgi:hypothetical protein
MAIVYVLIGSSILVLIFLFLWLKEKRKAELEYIAYGLRANDDSDENTKTNITVMEAGFQEAMAKLEALGEAKKDQWGKWIWTKTGLPVGQIDEAE